MSKNSKIGTSPWPFERQYTYTQPTLESSQRFTNDLTPFECWVQLLRHSRLLASSFWTHLVWYWFSSNDSATNNLFLEVFVSNDQNSPWSSSVARYMFIVNIRIVDKLRQAHSKNGGCNEYQGKSPHILHLKFSYRVDVESSFESLTDWVGRFHWRTVLYRRPPLSAK